MLRNQAASVTWGTDRRIRSQVWALLHRGQLQSACPRPFWSNGEFRRLQPPLQMSWMTPDQRKPNPANHQVLQLILSLVPEMAIFDHITPPFGGLPSGGELARALLPGGAPGLAGAEARAQAVVSPIHWPNMQEFSDQCRGYLRGITPSTCIRLGEGSPKCHISQYKT